MKEEIITGTIDGEMTVIKDELRPQLDNMEKGIDIDWTQFI